MSVRSLHVCYSFPPDAQGGTEIYVDGLCRGLLRQGIDAVVAAPDIREHTYDIGGVRVWRFLTSASASLGDLYSGDPFAAASFGRILDRETPDLVHQHAMSPACSVLLAMETKRRGLPLVFTYHTPTASCQRGTLLLWGDEPCDGRLDVARCAACSLEGLGTGRVLGRSLAAVPPSGGDLLARMGRQGGAWTALRMSSLIRRQHRAFNRFVAAVDRFVVLTPWVETLLRINGVPDAKMIRSRHGIAQPDTPVRLSARASARRIRVAHLGRMDPAKGTDVLIRALGAIPNADLELDIYGIIQGAASASLAEHVRVLAADDARIRFLPALQYEHVIGTLSEYDLVAVPSQWMETGPLVVLEAFAAGVPVLGSALGGIADNVQDGIDGLLVRRFNAADAWSEALTRCATEAGLLTRLRKGIHPPRTIDEVADDMRALYSSLMPTFNSAQVG